MESLPPELLAMELGSTLLAGHQPLGHALCWALQLLAANKEQQVGQGCMDDDETGVYFVECKGEHANCMEGGRAGFFVDWFGSCVLLGCTCCWTSYVSVT